MVAMRKLLTGVTAALALFAVTALPSAAQEAEDATCGGDEACSEAFAEEEAVQQSWDSGGISYEAGGESEGASIATSGGGNCTTMTISSEAGALATRCLAGGASPEVTWQYTLIKLSDAAGDGGYYSAGGAAEPSASATDPSTSTTLVSSPDPSVAGGSVTLTATIAHPAPGTPAGAVEFFDGVTSLGTAAIDAAGTHATLTTTALGVGAHTLSATYSGDAFYTTSTGSDPHTVDAPPAPTNGERFTATQTGPATWEYTLTFLPLDNYAVEGCGSSGIATITLTGLSGVTGATAPTSTDLLGGGKAPNEGPDSWVPSVSGGGSVVTWTHQGGGTGNFSDERHSFGFTVSATGAANGAVTVASDGFSTDVSNGCHERDFTETTLGPVAP